MKKLILLSLKTLRMNSPCHFICSIKLKYKKNNYFYTLLLILFATTAHQAIAADDKTYIVGIVPQFETHRLHSIWRPILTELEQRTGLKFKLRGSPTIPGFEQEFLNGQFDFAYMNPYHVLLANKEKGYIPLVRDHGKKLYGVLVVTTDSPYKSVRDLDNKTIAFPAPNALGASLLIRADMQDVHKIHITPKYVKTHDSVYLNTAMKRTNAGGGVQKTFNNQPDKIRNRLRVIYKTREVAPHPFVAHPRINNDITDRVKNALIAMGQEEKSRQLLGEIPIKQIGPSSMADYQPLSLMGLERFYIKP